MYNNFKRFCRKHMIWLGVIYNLPREDKSKTGTKLSMIKYQIGDLVYKLDSATKIGQSSKLKPVWKGPLLVTKVISPVLLKIRDKRGEYVIHHDRLKLCRDRTIPLWNRFLTTGSSLPDPTDLLDSDTDLNLDLLYRDEVMNAISSSPSLTDSQVQDSALSVPLVPVSRRSRPVRLPRYLRDYAT
jgi:hypothetical protein